MAHSLACALQYVSRIWERRPLKEPDVHVRGEYIDVAEGHIAQTGNRTAVMQELPDFVAAFSHPLKPLARDGSQFPWMLIHPLVDGGIVVLRTVESKQFCFHCRRVTLISNYPPRSQNRDLGHPTASNDVRRSKSQEFPRQSEQSIRRG